MLPSVEHVSRRMIRTESLGHPQSAEEQYAFRQGVVPVSRMLDVLSSYGAFGFSLDQHLKGIETLVLILWLTMVSMVVSRHRYLVRKGLFLDASAGMAWERI